MKFGRVIATVILAPALIIGCSKLYNALEEEIEEEVRNDVRRAGQGGVPTEPPVEPQPSIDVNRVSPDRGLVTGGETVEVIGGPFTVNATVTFDDVSAPSVIFVSEGSLRVVTPAGSEIGPVTVAVTDGELDGELPAGFTYFEEVTITDVIPNRGPTSGGTLIEILGSGFVEPTQVQFGFEPPFTATIVDSGKLLITQQPLPWGTYAVTVININGEETLTSAFSTYEPIRITHVEPFVGPLGGGTDVTVFGQGFVPGAQLILGAQAHTAGTNAAETEIVSTTLAASPATEGPVDVEVVTEFGSATLQNGFTYIDTTNATGRVIAISPATGLLSGGRSISIAGVGFDAPPTNVTIGGNPAACTVVSDNQIDCTTPASAVEGNVDVRVQNAGMDVTVTDGFRYIDLQLNSIDNDRGAIAGGTYVTITGKGYASDLQVFVNDQVGRDFDVVSNTEANFRTPPGAEGNATVRIETQGVAIEVPDFFTYFNPANMIEWSSGNEILRSINATVVQANGTPVESAFVMLGTDGTTPYQGLTNANGQITLSGPDIIGPQTVSAGKAGHSRFSWVDVNAENLTFQVDPGGMGSGELPPPPPTGIVRGNIVRVKDQYNYGNDIVLVTTTVVSFSQRLPDPGPLSSVINRGPYEIVVRQGDIVMIGLAGTVNSEGGFDVHAMGFTPFVSITEDGQQVEDVDIVIDTPLNQPWEINFDDPPLETSGGPNGVSSFIWYDFGYQGLYAMGRYSGVGTEQLVVNMPRQLPGSLEDTPIGMIAGAYYILDGNRYVPQSEVRLSNLTDTVIPVDVTPMLGAPYPIFPVGSAMGDPLSFEFSVNKTPLPNLPPANLHLFIEPGLIPTIVWRVLTPGDNTTFELPVFPEVAREARLTPGITYSWQLLPLYSPNVLSFHQLNYGALLDWRSRSANISSFLITE